METSQVPPSFFILGAPKCGTTSLASQLGQHPNAFVCNPKEPNFFCSDFPKLSVVQNLPDYLRLFHDVPATTAISGEASTWYLYSDCAVRQILEFCPSAKLIVMLRNPVDMFLSLHRQYLWNLWDVPDDPELAWEQQDTSGTKKLLRYRDVCGLGTLTTRLLDTADSSQVHTVLLDDMRENASRAYMEVLAFLELPQYTPTDFSAQNTRKAHRSSRIGQFLRKPPKPIDHVLRAVKRALRIEAIGLSRWLQGINTKPISTRAGSSPEIRPTFRKQLVREFHDEIETLESTIGRSLAHWRK